MAIERHPVQSDAFHVDLGVVIEGLSFRIEPGKVVWKRRPFVFSEPVLCTVRPHKSCSVRANVMLVERAVDHGLEFIVDNIPQLAGNTPVDVREYGYIDPHILVCAYLHPGQTDLKDASVFMCPLVPSRSTSRVR